MAEVSYPGSYVIGRTIDFSLQSSYWSAKSPSSPSIDNKLRTVAEGDADVNGKGREVVHFYDNVEQVYSIVELTYFLNIYPFFFATTYYVYFN